MELPLQISFRRMESSDAIEELVRTRVAKLDTFADRIMSCRVVIEPAGKHRRRGNVYEVRINLTVPGEEIGVTREPAEDADSRQLPVAVRNAFDSAARKLKDYVQRRRGFVKHHNPR